MKNMTFRKSLTAAAVAASLGFPALAIAQDAQTDVNAEEEVERIQVTGSRIKSANLMSASPLQVFDGEDIDKSGVANIQDLLLDNPAFGSPAINRTNSNFSTSGAGIATIDLRNLGSARTLVLVNGRRFVAGLPGSSAVDLNSIPTQFIERVEILTGGASAVYGSDAVAGVVNIVTKKNFEGVEIDTQYGESAEGDATERQFNINFGTASDKGHIMTHLGYSDQGAVFSRDRERSAVDQISSYLIGASDDPADLFSADRPFYSSYAPQGQFTAGDQQYTFDDQNNVLEGFYTNGNEELGRAPDGFNRSAYRTIAIPTERYLLATQGGYDLNASHSVFFEGTYSYSETVTELEPYPLASGDIYSNGQVPIEFLVNGQVQANPYVPQEIFDNATDTDGDGFKDLSFTKRPVDIGARGSDATRDTYRFVLGAEGMLSDTWSYEAYYVYGQTKEAQRGTGQVNVLNMKAALESVTDTQDLDGDGITDEVVCLDPDARAFGCAPINMYGTGTMSPEAVSWVEAPSMYSSRITQEILAFHASGDLMYLPAGPLAIATGVEYREETSRDEFDALQQLGLNAGNALPPTYGEFDVTEAYIETNVPVIDGVELRAAVRGSDYSTVGNTVSWNVGVNWEATDELRLRVIKSESVRAPNIGELFSPPSQTFPTGLQDPCEGVTAGDTGTTAERCLAEPGVAANVAANGAFTLNQSDIQGVSGYNRGNPDLEEETGKSLTVGAVWTPDSLVEGLGVTVDYFKIEVEDAIVGTPRQFILDQCYSGDQGFCDFIIRRPGQEGLNSPGSLDEIDSAVSNSGGEYNEGVDITANYSAPFGPGSLKSSISYTYVIDAYSIPLPGAARDPYVGEIGAAEHKAYFNVGYSWDSFDVNMRGRYIGESSLDDQFLNSIGFEPESYGVGSITYVDLQGSYQVTDSVQVYGGVNNLLDREAPFIPTGVPGGNTGVETAAGTYDAIGQSFYLGFRAKF
jgi:outer membrane receptor protein involved in Fe transport